MACMWIALADNGRVALVSTLGKYLAAEDTGSLIANRNACGPWSLFEITEPHGHVDPQG